jgi:hypothetical protein
MAKQSAARGIPQADVAEFRLSQPSNASMSTAAGNQLQRENGFVTGVGRGVIVALSVLYLIIAMHTPIGVFGTSPHDDGLFIGHALNVVNGNWFGPYDQLTLAKGQGYTFVLLLGYASGLPITLTHALLYLGSVLCVTLAVGRLTSVAWLPLVLYAVLLFHPAAQALRVARDSIYASQVLLICGALLFLMIACQRDQFRPLLAVGAGLLFGWFWLTKEEGIWMVPGLALLFFGTGWLHHRRGGSLRPLIKTSALFLAASIGVNIAYAAINMIEYGKFISVDFKEGNFESALSALQGVRVGDIVPYVPVPQAVRSKIYAASPSFAELKNYLDGDASPGSGWRTFGCQVYPSTCGDIAGGWFVWALRDAVASKGYYKSPSAASEYYERLTNEIRSACESGRLTCSPSVVAFMPQITSSQLSTIPAKLLETIELLTFIKSRPQLYASSSSTTPQIEALLGRPLQVPQQVAGGATYKLVGWYHAKGTQWFRLRCEGGGDANVTIRRMPSPDVAKALGDTDALRQRFEIVVKYDPACPLELDGVGKHAVNFAELLAGPKAFSFGDETLYIDSHEVIGSTLLVDRLVDWARELRKLSISDYTMLLPLIGCIGLIAYLAQFVLIVTKRAQVTLLFVITSSLWLMIAARLAVVVLVDISSFPAIDPLYLMPAYPLLCLASLLSAFGLFVSLSVKRSQPVSLTT